MRKAPDVLVYAEATALHLGRTTHLWNVDIKTENGRLVSTVRVTNFIVKDKSESWEIGKEKKEEDLGLPSQRRF